MPKKEQRSLFIGLMSGTSGDGIDAVLADFSAEKPQLITTLAHEIPAKLKKDIYRLMVPGDNEIDLLGVVDHELGLLFAEAANRLVTKSGIDKNLIRAIGCHGQTIRHRPIGTSAKPFTLQITDPNIVAEKTGIDVVADIRRRDMAAGGHGAPLAPAFHHYVFRSDKEEHVILNIGGISNTTFLSPEKNTIGFDTGPGNGLMDSWIQQNKNCDFDRNGEWAKSGEVNNELLAKLLSHDYFALPAPKSTGREMFTMDWLRSCLSELPPVPAEDIQATLLRLTVETIRNAIFNQNNNFCGDVFVCGGGAYNQFLMQTLSDCMPDSTVSTTAALGIAPEWVEGAAFAWFASRTIEGLSSNLPTVTGAAGERILGAIYQA